MHFAAMMTGFCALALGACAPSFSPNTYSSNAVQLANRVEAGSIIGFREVKISANGNIGAVTGGAVGGVLGAEYANSALIAVGGTTVGGMLGNALEHAARDTTGWEYIIRKDNGDMLSVTQREAAPLALAQRVLVIMGPQARVVPDYSIPQEPRLADSSGEDKREETKEAKAEPVRVEPVKVEVVLSLPPGMSVQPRGDVAPAAADEESIQPPLPLPLPEERLPDAPNVASLTEALAVDPAPEAETGPPPAP